MSSGTTVTSLETSSQVTDYGRRREETNKMDMGGKIYDGHLVIQ